VLARIRVDDEQVSALEKDLGNILDLVDQLAAADTDSVEPMAHPLNAVQRLRADEVTETNQREAFQAIAPATENGLYLVPRVIE
jgi:aspartyl-tRNA(Asn)/glutamyl-tRNA(Gln) amidotransferase subunit C